MGASKTTCEEFCGIVAATARLLYESSLATHLKLSHNWHFMEMGVCVLKNHTTHSLLEIRTAYI